MFGELARASARVTPRTRRYLPSNITFRRVIRGTVGQRVKRVIAAISRAVIALGKSDDEYARMRARDNKTQRISGGRR